jgi:MFS family permease
VSPRARRVAVGVSGAAVLLAALDTYVVVTLIIEMAADMNVAVNRLERATPIVTGFLLGYIAGMPLLGGLSDKLGRRAVIQICLGGFLVGSAITAASVQIGEWFEVAPLPILIAGRALQGLAGGALLPVTMALVADLWAEERRPAILGTVGGAQELGSVLGPLYGSNLALLIGWQGIFWINVPLAIAAGIAVHYTVPGRSALSHARRKVDVVGGILLAVACGLLTLGLYNADPENSVLPPWGIPFVVSGAGVVVVFLLWEWRARTKLVDLAGSAKLPFAAVLIASFIAGAALLVTLFDVVLLARGVLGYTTQEDAAKLLIRFLVALPIGAVVGGLIARRLGLRAVSVAGFLIAAFAYWLVSNWPVTILSERHNVLGLSLPRLDTDLAIAGFGLGLVIAPLSAAVLRIVPPSQHGVASAGVVVARTMGMLVGFAGLTGWGLHRFHELTADLVPPDYPFLDPSPANIAVYNAAYEIYIGKVNNALLIEYHEVFFATGVCCLVAAVVSVWIGTRRQPQEEFAVDGNQSPAVAA